MITSSMVPCRNVGSGRLQAFEISKVSSASASTTPVVTMLVTRAAAFAKSERCAAVIVPMNRSSTSYGPGFGPPSLQDAMVSTQLDANTNRRVRRVMEGWQNCEAVRHGQKESLEGPQ